MRQSKTIAREGGMLMISSPTSSLSEFSKGRVVPEPSTKSPRYSRMRNLITTARLWPAKLVALPVARLLMVFLVGFAAGVVWHAYGIAGRKVIASWSPHLAWLAPAAGPDSNSSERLKTMSIALAAAQQSLDKLSAEISKVQESDGDAPPRKGQDSGTRRHKAAR
jgi:hypothetical protein